MLRRKTSYSAQTLPSHFKILNDSRSVPLHFHCSLGFVKVISYFLPQLASCSFGSCNFYHKTEIIVSPGKMVEDSVRQHTENVHVSSCYPDSHLQNFA